MRFFNLLEQSHPNLQRKVDSGWRTEENKIIAKRYDRDFFDGDRVNGYGGYYYDGRWKKVVQKMIEEYGINNDSNVLDIGSAKGFLIHDLREMLPGINAVGIDISKYAVNHTLDGYSKYLIKNGISEKEAGILEKSARERVLPNTLIGNAKQLPWMDETFDVVLSINTTHNLPYEECKQSLREILRVSKPNGKNFIQVDAFGNEEEYRRMKNWVLTAETMLSEEEWLKLFKEVGYDGDYYWTKV